MAKSEGACRRVPDNFAINPIVRKSLQPYLTDARLPPWPGAILRNEVGLGH